MNYTVNENAIPTKVEEGTTVVFEVDVPAHGLEASSIVRRDFDVSLHPLAARRFYPKHMEEMLKRDVRHMTGSPVARKPSLSFSINGGEMVPTGVTVPSAVYPWVLLGWEGDAVTLVKVETIDEEL